jgi:hypothetical protein
MRARTRQRHTQKREVVYDVVRDEAGWAVVRGGGGYRERLPTREAAVTRACEICRQLAPARVRILGAESASLSPPSATEEIVYERSPRPATRALS